MAYSKKIVAEAKRLFTVEGLSFEKIANQLVIARHQTVIDWAQKDNWKQMRTEIAQKSEEILIEKYSLDKARIKYELVKGLMKTLDACLAFIKYASEQLIDPVTKKLKPDAIHHKDFPALFNMIRIMEPRVCNSARALDDIVFNKNKVAEEADVSVKVSGLIKALINEAKVKRTSRL